MDNTITREEALTRYADVECTFRHYDGKTAVFTRTWPRPLVPITMYKPKAFEGTVTLTRIIEKIDSYCKPGGVGIEGGRIDFQIESHIEQHPKVRHIVFDSTADAGWEY
jgi:hypothetical protein